MKIMYKEEEYWTRSS